MIINVIKSKVNVQDVEIPYEVHSDVNFPE